ncbi:BMP family ABC transporter substrate-binding protein [Calidifontibacter sp. DB0510]|uniref:BMP family ABC transporter substrate-binding protein n=2 Tax=Metallococcus carri TaxID=1656884 RepID=A0A967B856_9MICO|nr:BMP family ABC transporter substrate-binding protein [Metallococcus carri]NOP38845.1 BMP family ABC transporter substrate-binding protein [Calidifontibacter sp. DB2511S]
MKIAAVTAAATMVLAGCGSKPGTGGGAGGSGSGSDSGTGTASGKKISACMVLDTGGVDDKSFNENSWAGMQKAAKDNPNITIKYVPSNSGTDYTPNLTKYAQGGCSTVIAVGGLMGDAVKGVAAKFPKVQFAEIDNSNQGVSNIYGIEYNTAQGGFLAGYLAAGMTKTGTVGTWGGLPIPPVTIYMDGFWEGVQYYNKAKGKNVKVLGWDEKNQKGGTFASSFTDQNKGKSITQSMQSQGADIVFPVAGGAGVGAGAAAAAAGGKLNLIWVDTDGCTSAAQYCKYFISSATKNLSGGVETYLKAASSGNFPTGNYIGDLKNGGVGLAPYNQFDSKVPDALKKEVDQVKADIISGKITITSPSQPK